MTNRKTIKMQFSTQGFVVIDNVLEASALKSLIQRCESELNVMVGTRNLLKFEWVKKLAQELKNHPSVRPLLPDDAVVAQCNYFSKDREKNWSVALHRDLSIPVRKRLDIVGWSAWSEKEGLLYAHPPREVLSSVVAVRLHLEDNDLHNGALQFVPGSHRNQTCQNERVLGVVNEGGILAMSPLILHASTKLKAGKRRVLHFVFGPKELPNGMEWQCQYENETIEVE